jgi:hypothetical protein
MIRRLEVSDLIPPHRIADYLAHVARLESVRTTQEFIRVWDEADPRFIEADLRLRPEVVDAFEMEVGRLLLFPNGTDARREGLRLRKALRALRATFAIGERRDGRPPKNLAVDSGRETNHDQILVWAAAHDRNAASHPPSAGGNRKRRSPIRRSGSSARMKTISRAATAPSSNASASSVRVRRLE